MITAESSSENIRKSNNRRFFNKAFFGFQLRTGWPLLVVFIFVFLLSMVIPTAGYLIEIGKHEYQYDDIVEGILEYVHGIGFVNIFVSMFCGFLCGMVSMRFVNNKVAVNFYHSLPLKRESQYICTVLQHFIYYAAAYVSGLAVMFTLLSVKYHNAGAIISPVIHTFLYGVIFFFLIYSMTMLGASLTGTGFMRFVAVCYIIFLPIAVYCLFITMLSVNNGVRLNLDISFYATTDRLIALCPPLRVLNFLRYEGTEFAFAPLFSKNVLITVIITLIMFAVSFVLYIWRKSESATMPVIWRPASFVFKYASIFVGGTIFGLLFMVIFDSYEWMIFGILLGSVITFMLVNGILNKSARAIFKGLTGFGVYLGVMAVITIVFYCDVFGIFSSIPSPELVSRVEININDSVYAKYGGDFAYRATKLLNEAYNNCHYYGDPEDYENIKYYEYYYDYETDEVKIVDDGYDSNDLYLGEIRENYNPDYMNVSAIFRTKFGFPLAVSFSTDCEAAAKLSSFIEESGSAESVIPQIDKILNWYTNIDVLEYRGYINYLSLQRLSSDDAVEIVKKLSDPMGVSGDSPIVGTFNFTYSRESKNTLDINDRKRAVYYVKACDIDVLNILYPDYGFRTEEDVINVLTDGVSKMIVCKGEEGTAVKIEDPEKILEISKSLYSFTDNMMTPYNCTKDHRYRVFIIYESSGEYSYGVSELSFRDGCVPDFLE